MVACLLAYGTSLNSLMMEGRYDYKKAKF